MTSTELGRRYERLLFLSAPISLAAMIVCIVAIASSTQADRVEARCYERAVSVFGPDLQTLEHAWNGKNKKDDIWFINYKLKLQLLWLKRSPIDQCFTQIDNSMDTISRESPGTVMKNWSTSSNKLLNTPISIYGISLPENATFRLSATTIQISFTTLTRALQIVLLPILLLWLGSLYATRYRESLTTQNASSLSDVFPHIINMYPAFNSPAPRKRNRLAPYAKPVAQFSYTVVRIFLLSVFVLPPVLIYGYSLYLVGMQQSSMLYAFAGIVVGVFCATTVLAEFLPAHYRKVFPDASGR